VVPEAEEGPSVPACAGGDGARDGGQRLVGTPLPLEAIGCDGDHLLDALPFAQKARASDGTVAVETRASLCPVPAVQFLAEPFQSPDRLGLQPAIGEFLDAIGQAVFKVAPVEGRRLAVEQVAPLRLQLRRRRGLERGQARGDGVVRRHAVSVGFRVA
jgi:hypothetical protein